MCSCRGSTYIALLVFVIPFDFILQTIPTQLMVTTVNSSVSRPTTIPRAMLASLEVEAKLLHTVELPSVCDGVTYAMCDGVTTTTVLYTVDDTVDISMVLGDGHEVMVVVLLGSEQGRRVVTVDKVEE